MKKYIGIFLGIMVIVVIGIAIFFMVKNKQTITPVSSVDISAVFNTALTTKHISTPDTIWPPAVKFSEGVFSCNPQGSDTAEAGKVELKTVAGTRYCVTTRSEGAAGSTYTTYMYTAELKNRLVTISFTLRFVQCDNYDDPKKNNMQN